MTRLFAGIGPHGEMRFIGEVLRGAACGCRCPECDSQLIAKQGSEKEWHFAHEAGQERPECLSGAMNMLRRLAIEYLLHRDLILLPPYCVSVRAPSQLGGRTETVQWSAQLQGPLNWLPRGPRSAPVAISRLDSQVDAQLFVEIGEPYPARPNPAAGMAAIEFICSIPPLSDLRVRIQAEQHLRNFGHLQWRYHPDTFGIAAEAQRRVDAKAAEDAARVKRMTEERARDVQIHRLASERQASHSSSHQAEVPVTERPIPPAEPAYPWAPLAKPKAAFIFYRLKDGSAWVVYTMADDTPAIAPWPKEEGWDEALPLSLGTADPALGVYRGNSVETVMIFFGQRAVRTHATRDPLEFSTL